MIAVKLVGGAKKSFDSDQFQIEKSDISVNQLLDHLLKIKPSNTSELDIENTDLKATLEENSSKIKTEQNLH